MAIGAPEKVPSLNARVRKRKDMQESEGWYYSIMSPSVKSTNS